MTGSSAVLQSITPMLPAGKDMQAALAFYEHKLGFRAIYKAGDLSMAILQRDAVEIMLTASDDPHTASQTSLRIQLSGVDALYAEYQQQAIAPFEQVDGPGMTTLKPTPWGTREFAVRDVAGVCITFYEDRAG